MYSIYVGGSLHDVIAPMVTIHSIWLWSTHATKRCYPLCMQSDSFIGVNFVTFLLKRTYTYRARVCKQLQRLEASPVLGITKS